MKLYLKSKVFSLHSATTVYDAHEQAQYTAKSPPFTLVDSTTIWDRDEKPICRFSRKFLSFRYTYQISMENGETFSMSMEIFHFAKQVIQIKELGWTLTGNFWEHDYTMENAHGETIASLHRAWLSWGETFEIDICKEAEVNKVVAILVALERLAGTRSAAT